LGIAVAWRHGWPAWSASWLGLLLFILLYLWGPSFIYLPEYEWNTMPRLLKMLLSETILPLLWLLTLYWLMQHWSHVGLLAFLPAMVMEGVLYTEFVPPVSASLIMFIIWLAMAVVGVLLLRLRQRQWDVWIISIGALFGWSLYLYAGHFLTEVVVREQTVTAMVTNLVPLMLRGLVPLIGLMLFHALWLWAQAAGRFVLQSYRYFFIGIFLNLAASLSFRRLLLPDDLVAFQVMGVWVITAVFLLSLSLMATGSARLIRHHHQWIVHANWLVHLLLTLVLVFPLIYQAEAIVAGYNSLVRNQLSFELLFWQWTPTQRIFLTVSLRFVGLIWLLLSGVALSLFHHRQPSEPTATADLAFPP
jgi:hypothetical protein